DHTQVGLGPIFSIMAGPHRGCLNRDQGADSHLHVDPKSHHLADAVIFVNKALAIRQIEVLVYPGKVKFYGAFTLGNDLFSLGAEKKCAHDTFEVAYTRFRGVIADKVPKNFALLLGVEEDFILSDHVTLPNTLYQELPGNGDFFVHAVPVKKNDLTAVENRRRDRIDCVGRQYEMAVRKVYIDGALGVLVMEKVVLLR